MLNQAKKHSCGSTELPNQNFRQIGPGVLYDLQRYLNKVWQIRCELYTSMYILCGFSTKVICAFLNSWKQWRNYQKICKLKGFKGTVSLSSYFKI